MNTELGSSIYGIFLCLAEIEKVTARLYNDLSNKVSDSFVSGILDFISFDSTKHYMILSDLANIYKVVIKDKDKNCAYLLGNFYLMSIDLVREINDYIREKDSISLDELNKILNKLVSYEGKIGEEYVTEIVTKLIVDLGELDKGVKRILELINEDENRHVSLLKEILLYLKK
ncbi:MAG: hypothetical protein J7K23_09940 [Thermoproteales archaeon]|nr:hypothetical protein [Thermoproteales archaeon]